MKTKRAGKNPEEVLAEGLEEVAKAAPELKSRIVQNVIDKVNGGGIPTAREQAILDRAMNQRGPGRPAAAAVRWTTEHAATEFGLDRRTLAKRLNAGEIAAGADGKYSTRDICRAVFEGANARDEKDREQAESFRLKNQELRRERIPIRIVLELLEEATQAMAATLKAAKGKTLSPEKINELLEGLRGIPAVLKW